MKAKRENYNLSNWILGLEMALIYSTVFLMLGYQQSRSVSSDIQTLICDMWYVIYDVRYVMCDRWYVMYGIWNVLFDMWYVICDILQTWFF